MNDTVLQAAKAGCVNSINDVLSASTSILKASVTGRYKGEQDSWFGAEDIVQDLLLEVYQSLSDLRATTWKQYCAWLRIVAARGVYKRIEYLHAKKRYKNSFRARKVEAVKNPGEVKDMIQSWVGQFKSYDECQARTSMISDYSVETAVDQDALSPDEIAIENEESDAIASLAADLNPEQWQVFSLSMEGLKSREIADMLDKPVARVYQLHRAAKAKLELALS